MVPSRDALAFRQILATVVLAISSACSTVPGRERSLVVLDLASWGIPQADAATVSDRVGRALAATGRFRLVRSDNAEVCRDANCAVRVGRLLKVDRVVMGELSIDGPAWVMSTRMVDVATSSLLLRTSVRTESGYRDLVERGTVVLASRYDSAESRLDTVLARHKPEDIRGIRDTVQETILKEQRHLMRVLAGTTGGTGIGALFIGFGLFTFNTLRGTINGHEPDMTATFAWFGAGVALELAAFASVSKADDLSRRLEAMQRKSLLDLTWAPVWAPSTGAVGLATRLDF